MLIVCPKCFAQYAVSDEISIKKGQKFHCSSCQNYFVLPQADMYNLTDETEEIPTVSAVMQASSQPEKPLMGSSVMPAVASPVPTPSIQLSSPVPVNEPSAPIISAQPEPTYIDSIPSNDSEPRFVEPLSLLANETPHLSDRLDTIPEEFKPVAPSKKKASVGSILFHLLIAGAICATAYAQRDNIIKQIDTFILTQLDKKPIKETEKTTQKYVVMPEMSGKSVAATKPTVQAKPVEKAPTATKPTAQAQPNRADPTDAQVQPNQVVATLEDIEKSVLGNTPIVDTTDNTVQTIEKQSETGHSDVVGINMPLQQASENNVMRLPNEQVHAAAVGELEVNTKTNHSADLPVPALTDTSVRPIVADNVAELPALVGTLNAVPSLKQEGANPEVNEQIIRDKARVPDSFAALAETGKPSTQNISSVLKIQDISYVIAPNEAGVMRLMIKGEIANTELESVVIPEVKAVVYNAEDMVVARKRIILSQPQIEGNSVQPFFSSVVPAPAQVSRVEVVFDE